MYKRAEFQVIKSRLEEPRKFIQVVMGPRQVGKSTIVKQVLAELDTPYQLFSADSVPATNRSWVADCWAYIVSQSFTKRFEVFYWRERNDEVDFVLRKKDSVVAIEVKSNAESNTTGLSTFKSLFHPSSALIVGDSGISPEEFLSMDLRTLF